MWLSSLLLLPALTLPAPLPAALSALPRASQEASPAPPPREGSAKREGAADQARPNPGEAKRQANPAQADRAKSERSAKNAKNKNAARQQAEEPMSEEERELRLLGAMRRIVEEEKNHDDRLRELLGLRRESLRRGQDHRVESLEILLEREIVRHEEFLARGRVEMGEEAFGEAYSQAHELLAAEMTDVVDRIQQGKLAARDAAKENRSLAEANDKLRAHIAEAAAGPAVAGAPTTDEERRKALRQKYIEQGKALNPSAKSGLRQKGGQGGGQGGGKQRKAKKDS